MGNAKCLSTARLDGKTALITGCNTGIGKITVQDFFERGARVIMACRNLEKANEAASEIKQACKEKQNLGEILVTQLDLMSLKSVRNCAKHLLETERRLDLLVNNAGVMMCPEGRTEDGFETQFGTNHLGHFLLTLLVLPRIIESAPARIVILSSVAHEVSSPINFEDLNHEKRKYSAVGAYQQSKLANVLFARELSKRLREANITGVNTYALHPGVIKTELGRHIRSTYMAPVSWVWNTIFTHFMKTPEQGAQTSIYCSVDEACAEESGLYYAECKVKTPSKHARNDEMAKKLWEVSCKMVELEDDYDPFKKQ